MVSNVVVVNMVRDLQCTYRMMLLSMASIMFLVLARLEGAAGMALAML